METNNFSTHFYTQQPFPKLFEMLWRRSISSSKTFAVGSFHDLAPNIFLPIFIEFWKKGTYPPSNTVLQGPKLI